MSASPIKPLVTNAADPAQVKEATTRVKLNANQAKDDLLLLLGTVQGRRFFWRYLSECGVFRLSKDPSGSETYFNEGKRSIGLRLLDEITAASPDAYLQMMKEHRKQ